jgi:hypothetical protein
MKSKLGILFLLFIAFIVVSCGENEQEREREIKKLVMTFSEGIPCVSVKIKPDSADKTMLIVTGILEDSSRIEALVKKDENGKYVGRETFSSILARDMSANIGVKVTDLSVQLTDASGNFKGKASLKTGETISFVANYAKGWYPENELNTLQIITKHQIVKALQPGQVLESFSIAPETPSSYRGMYRLKSGAEQGIYVVHSGEAFSWALSDAKAPIALPNQATTK